MFYFVNSAVLIPNQLTDSFRKVINHSREGLWWTCPRIHGSGGLGTDISEKETELTTHHTTLKSVKDKDITFNPNLKLGRNKAHWGCSARGRGRQIQSKQAAKLDPRIWWKETPHRAGELQHSSKLVRICLLCSTQHTRAQGQRGPQAGGNAATKGEQCLHQGTC